MSHPRISSDPAVMMGKPCIKGTRITVELILRKIGRGSLVRGCARRLPASYRGGLEGSVGLCRRLHAARNRSPRLSDGAVRRGRDRLAPSWPASAAGIDLHKWPWAYGMI